jgi:hypothetical protein
MKTAVEELIAVRYMLRCLGVKVLHASLICGDNLGVIQNCTIKDSLLKKKHIAIAYTIKQGRRKLQELVTQLNPQEPLIMPIASQNARP